MEIKETAKFLAKIFCNCEPMTKALKIAEEELTTVIHQILEEVVQENLSLIAINLKNQEIIGSLIAKDLNTHINTNIVENTMHKILPIFSLLDQLVSDYRNTCGSIKNGEVCHIIMVGVKKEFYGQKISVKLLQELEKRATKNNFVRGITEASSPASYQIFSKYLEYKSLNQIPQLSYKDFDIYGNKVFAQIAEASGCNLLYKEYF